MALSPAQARERARRAWLLVLVGGQTPRRACHQVGLPLTQVARCLRLYGAVDGQG